MKTVRTPKHHLLWKFTINHQALLTRVDPGFPQQYDPVERQIAWSLACRVVRDNELDMTPLQFIEVGVAPDESDDEDILAFTASDDYEDDAHSE